MRSKITTFVGCSLYFNCPSLWVLRCLAFGMTLTLEEYIAEAQRSEKCYENSFRKGTLNSLDEGLLPCYASVWNLNRAESQLVCASFPLRTHEPGGEHQGSLNATMNSMGSWPWFCRAQLSTNFIISTLQVHGTAWLTYQNKNLLQRIPFRYNMHAILAYLGLYAELGTKSNSIGTTTLHRSLRAGQ